MLEMATPFEKDLFCIMVMGMDSSAHDDGNNIDSLGILAKNIAVSYDKYSPCASVCRCTPEV